MGDSEQALDYYMIVVRITPVAYLVAAYSGQRGTTAAPNAQMRSGTGSRISQLTMELGVEQLVGVLEVGVFDHPDQIAIGQAGVLDYEYTRE